MIDEQRRQIIDDYNALLRETGEPKRAFREVRRSWREKLGTRGQPFNRVTLYRWATRLGVEILSSRIGHSSPRMQTNETKESLPAA